MPACTNPEPDTTPNYPRHAGRMTAAQFQHLRFLLMLANKPHKKRHVRAFARLCGHTGKVHREAPPQPVGATADIPGPQHG